MNICARFALSLLVLLMLHAALWGQPPEIVINEFVASNQTGGRDPDFAELSDWVELYNPAEEEVDLSGYYMTDDLDEPFKWQIPDGTRIPGAGFLFLWADGHDTGLHMSFKLNKAGEQLVLYAPDGTAVDTLSFGTQQDDMSYGRLETDATQWRFFSPPSPGARNDARDSVAVTPAPLFSITGGFYWGAQVLRFENAEQIDIYYSLDGTPPDGDALPYQAPIVLDTTVAVRAIGYQRGFAPSDVVTHTYFIDEPIHLPFISIVTDPDNFFSDERGIYVTGTNGRGGYCDSAIRNLKQDWERPVNIELYEIDGTLGFNQRAGVKIFGGCSRHRFPQKSLALFARRAYGKGSFRYQLFPDKDIDRFESFILRSSADDQVFTLFRDALSQMVLVEYMDSDYQAYRPAVVFLNGQYWGIHNIREKINEHYVAGNFHIDADDVNLLERNGSVVSGTDAGYDAMVDYANSHDMADPDHYEIVAAQIDIDQYIDYQIGHIYLAERDWPGNNIKFWRANSGPYARWRWVNFDMDQCFTSGWIGEDMIEKTTTRFGSGWPNPEWSTRLFRNLLENEGFRNEFVQRYAYHMNTTFNPDRVLALIDQFQQRLAPEIPRHITRWGGQKDPDALETWQSPTFNSVARWEQNIDRMRLFAVERPAPTTRHFLDHFGLSGTSEVSLDLEIPESAVLQVNGKRLPDGFQGVYFNDLPIVVEATPRWGYTFSHWKARSTAASSESLVSTGSVWKYSDTGMNLGTAWQETEYDDTAWPSGPAQLGYGDGDEATVVGYGPNASNKHITTYFRTSFELTEFAHLRSLSISLLVDDGAVAYLNGREIARVNMPSGRLYYKTPALQTIGNEDGFTEFEVSPDHLISGINVLAVEVHQASAGSSDISFDCSLSGETAAVTRTEQWIETPEVEVVLAGDMQLTAFCEADMEAVADPVVITEINFDSAPAADSGDWVELCNRSDAAVDLTGWQFSDGDGQAYTFPANTILWPDSYLVLCRDRISFKGIHPYVKNLLGNLPFGLSSEGESLRLLDAESNVVDRVDYFSITPWPQTAQGTGFTVELVDASNDNNRGENWQAASLLGTPGTGYEPPPEPVMRR
ncbi:MAG: CotH kinase family protein [Phycisphaerales bacterium]|nr:MAG: CotH kinase family protein [Phycisphaerales bacterium]